MVIPTGPPHENFLEKHEGVERLEEILKDLVAYKR